MEWCTTSPLKLPSQWLLRRSTHSPYGKTRPPQIPSKTLIPGIGHLSISTGSPSVPRKPAMRKRLTTMSFRPPLSLGYTHRKTRTARCHKPPRIGETTTRGRTHPNTRTRSSYGYTTMTCITRRLTRNTRP